MKTGILPDEFLKRMRGILGGDYDAFEAAMGLPPVRGLRVNTLKIGVEALRALSPFSLTPIPGLSEGFRLSADAADIGAHAHNRAGLFYIQEPSAMLPATLFDIQPGMRILDLCAAPGGKAGRLAAALNGEGLLIANDVDHARAQVLKRTLERLGVRNALVSCMRADALCALLEGWFDMVLLDAPCSGEGMFRKEPAAIRDWSLSHIHACAVRQAGLIDCASRALKPGGALIYSTCTYAPEENEGLVKLFLQRAPDFTLVRQERFYPHTGPGEGQYMALILKRGCDHDAARAPEPYTPPPLNRANALIYEEFLRNNLHARPSGLPLLLPDGRLMLLPESLPQQFNRLRLLNAGTHAGDIRKGVFHPAHALSMALPPTMFRNLHELTSPAEQRTYFTGGTLPGHSSGYTALTVSGHTVGLGKTSNGIIKNLLPKGLRGV